MDEWGEAENVNQALEKFKEEMRMKLQQAYLVGVPINEIDRNLGKTCGKYPHAVIKLKPDQSHLYPILLKEAISFMWQKYEGTEFIPGKGIEDYVRETIDHESDHAEELIRNDIKITGYGVIVGIDKRGLPDINAFIKHEKATDWIVNAQIGLAPRRPSHHDTISLFRGRMFPNTSK